MQQFGDYWLEHELARGGMGVVYRARQIQTGRPCALKLVLSGNRATPTQVHRFKREAMAQASLNHPHILRIFDGGEVQGNLYFSMELAEGGDVSNALEWSLPRKVELIAKIARALGFAHEQGYVHRDIKPDNILLTLEGEPKLTDFGLTKRLDSNTMLTQEGALMGTPFYMSPEQAQGQGSTAGPASDVFSLGVLLYHFVTGELPFTGTTTVQLLAGIVDGDQDAFVTHGINDSRLELITCKALEKNPSDRYPNGTAVAEDLERWLRGDDPTASRASSFSRIARKAQEHKTSLGVIVGGIALSLLVVGAIGGGVAYAFAQTKHEAAVARWENDARGLTRELEQTLAWGPEQVLQVIDARARATALLESDPSEAGGQEREDREALRAAVGKALAHELDLALLIGTQGGVEHALAVGGLVDSLDVDAADRFTRARLRAVTGAAEKGSPWLTVLAAWDPDQRPSGDALNLAYANAAAEVPARLAQGARLAREGKHDLARKAWGPLLEREDADLQCALASACWSSGEHALAFDAWVRALAQEPTCAPAAFGLANSAGRLGRFGAAREALAGGSDSSLEVRLARALLASEREPEQLDSLSKLEATPWGEVLRGDLKAESAHSPYATTVGLAGRAAHARWLAEHEEPETAREVLAELSLLSGGRYKGARPAPALIRRALCDVAGAYAALGESEPASQAIDLALWSDPQDLEAHALRAELVGNLEEVTQAFGAAARAELGSLDSALGLGVFVARASRAAAIQLEAERPQAGEAALLQRGTLGRPALRRALRGIADADPLPMAGAWVPLSPRCGAEDREQAQKLLMTAAEDLEKLELLREAAALDPHNAAVQFDLARKSRHVSASLGCYLERVRAFALAPYSGFSAVIEFRENWGVTASGGRDPSSATQRFLDEDPEDPARQVVWIMERYHGVLFPEAEEPSWSESSAEEVIRAIDSVLARDARYRGLLFFRAHMLELEGNTDRADRDLALAFKLAGRPSTTHALTLRSWGQLFHAWILTANRPRQAIKVLAEISRVTVERENAAGRVGDFLTTDPYFEQVVDSAPLRRLLNTIESR